jgi:hypothetical protein
MRSATATLRSLRLGAIAIAVVAVVALVAPASAQWTQVPGVTASDVFSVATNGDTIVSGADSFVYVSTNAGATWKRSVSVAAGVTSVRRVRIRNGRIYAGTGRFETSGQGVFVSDDLGDTWSDFSQGLAGPGSHDITDLLIRGDSLYAATDGSGAWVRNLTSGTWSPFGNAFDSQPQMTAIAAGGSRLLACSGVNGSVYFRDPGQADWTLSLLLNDRFQAGLTAESAAWNGRGWVVGSNIGVFHSATGESPWTFVDFGLRPLFFTAVVTRGADFFVSLGAADGTLIALSHDDGFTWLGLDTLAGAQTYDMALQETTLYAGRVGGLWLRSIVDIVSVPGGQAPSRLAFAIAGSQPVGDRVRFKFELPQAGPIAIEVFDVAGRRMGDGIREARPAGHGEIEWDAGRLPAGVYHARLTAAGDHATARLVRTAGGRR